MKAITDSLSKAIDAHASELILFGFGTLLLLAYWRTHDQLIGSTMLTVIGAALGLTTKRALNQTKVGNIEKVNIDNAEAKDDQQ